ncbi:MAG: lipid-A-disaccharide synthase [Pseudomonadota bacterium]
MSRGRRLVGRTPPGDITFRGVAGPLMQAEGMESLFPMEELSVMGISEVLPKYPALRRRLQETASDCLAFAPDALLTIDSPDFSLRLAKKVRAESDLRTIHYVAPSVWAWRPGRAAKMARHIDHVLALLPFEPPYMEAAGMTCDFTGHPVVAEPCASKPECHAFRAETGIHDAPLILVLPGSRKSEVARLATVFGDTMKAVLAEKPEARIVLPTVASVAAAVQDAVRTWPGAPVVIDPRDDPRADQKKRAAFGAADVALAASGTVSLELAANATPMVIGYDMSWLSWQVMSRMAQIDTVTLVNLIVGENIIPEFLGPDCRPPEIAKALVNLLDDRPTQLKQLAAMNTAMVKLGRDGEAPGLRAARSVLGALEAQ